MNFLKSWILNITSVVIFITIIELIFPNSSMKKYIKMIVGLLVMLVIINPILEVMHGKFQLEEDIFKASSAIQRQELVLNVKKFKGTQKKQIISVYKDYVEKYIKDQIEFNNTIHVLNIDATIEENLDSEKFGNIQKLSIVLSESDEQLSNEGIQPVSNINIHINENNENIKLSKKDHVLKEIREHIHKYYGLDENNIYIHIQKKKNK
ncbi:MAG: stage III sporulation protein AF [Marinisporobacter sp.]|jgi:stage III sporulation protein AF|nr:stage III sporulation protein AF [Marinisporobacter sp.]